jgi:hypothetical protein
MKLGVIATDGGKHSDEKLGFAVADEIVDVAAAANAKDAADARRLANSIGDIAATHMKAIADREMAGIAANGHAHLAEPLEAHPETADAMEAEIVAACKASSLKAWFDADGLEPGSVAADNVRRALKNIHEVVHKWTRTAQHMHRDCFAGSGKVGHHTELTDHPGWDANDEHVVRWRDLHAPKTPEHYRRAVHEHATGEKLPPI